MKRTKIICTLGPASNNRETLKSLMENGMDIARFNFSHGDHEEQKGRVDMIKELREELDMPIAMLLDTSLYLESVILKVMTKKLPSHMRHFIKT